MINKLSEATLNALAATTQRAVFWRHITNTAAIGSVDLMVEDYFQQLETAQYDGEKFLIYIALHQLGIRVENDTVNKIISAVQALDIKSTPYPRDIVEMGSSFLLSCETLTDCERDIIKAVLMGDDWEVVIYHTAQTLLTLCLGVYNSRKEFVKLLLKHNGVVPQGIVIDYQKSIDMLEYKYTFMEYMGRVYVFDWPFVNLPMPYIE